MSHICYRCQPKIIDLSADLFNNSLDDHTLSSEDHSILKSPKWHADERSGAKNVAEKYYTASTPCTTETFDTSSLLQDSSGKSSPVSSKIHRSQISFFVCVPFYENLIYLLLKITVYRSVVKRSFAYTA